MALDRRSVLSAGLGAGLAAATAKAGPRSDAEGVRLAATALPSIAELGLKPGAEHDQSAAMQAAIDDAAKRGAAPPAPARPFSRSGAAAATGHADHRRDRHDHAWSS